ncbi:MAG: peptidoglycan glycosyltransferase, partial [Saprospiraceae bacterium]|nr:peptidoglycan glycosyltransferase [Saprospiraceae bacterium]
MAKHTDYNKIMKLLVKWGWLSLITGIVAFFAAFVLVSFTRMPDTEELENPDYEQASIIYADDLSELGRFYSKNRVLLTYEELNPHLINALVATEDERFFRHSGIDARGTARAVIFLSTRGGASTITQQLAKQFFTKRSRSFVKRVWQKLKEWVIAIEFEKRYTKEEIIAMYLNKFEFIYSSFGVSSASRTYFGKEQKDLTLDEAAILIGMLKNPYIYNPKINPENAKRRRNVVLGQMLKNGLIEQAQFEELKELKIDMSNFNRTFQYEGLAPHFRTTLTNYLKKLFEQKKYRKPDGTAYNPFEDGLKIYTTINKTMQQYAEEAAFDHMAKIQKTYFNVWKNKDPWTYKADANQKRIRKDAFNRAVRESERYKNMRALTVGKIIAEIQSEIPNARLWESDINRMLGEEKETGYLNKLARRDIVSSSQIKTYKAIMRNPKWQQLKKERAALDQRAMEVFNQPRKMKVFSYEKGSEKTMTMTPMDSIRYHQKHMQIGSVSIDPSTGHVKAWVGGIGNKYFKYDHVLSNRQVGSTFKPFLYATALIHQGISPCQKIKDMQYVIPAGDPNFKLLDTWAPSNSRGSFTGDMVTLKEALRLSLNSVSVWLVKELGSVKLIRDLVDKMGIDKKKIPDAPSIVLGAAQVNVLEMTGAYATFANQGTFIEPSFLLRIEDKDGRIIYNTIPSQKRVFTEYYNDAMVKFLKHASSAVSWA